MRILACIGALALACCASVQPLSACAPAPTLALCGDGPRRDCRDAGELERLIARAPLEIVAAEPLPGFSHALRLTARLPDGNRVRLKWKRAGRGGDGWNRSPRHELAAWAVQRLVLPPDQPVVPPTVVRCLPRAQLARWSNERVRATFRGADCVLGTLSWWLEDARPLGRFAGDPAHRNAVARLNLVTYLIDHGDTKPANFVADDARAFAVDNGISFSALPTLRTWIVRDWSRLHVRALPRAVEERLARIDRHALDQLAVLAQLELRDGKLVPVAPGPAFDPDRGVRRRGDVIQLGLTRREIDALELRLAHVRALVGTRQLARY